MDSWTRAPDTRGYPADRKLRNCEQFYSKLSKGDRISATCFESRVCFGTLVVRSVFVSIF